MDRLTSVKDMSQESIEAAIETEIVSSPLGTKDYWDEIYERDLNVFNETGDEGEIWFGKSIQKKLIEWIKEKMPSYSAVLDVGCGNGQFLAMLHDRHGFDHLVGIDYSEAAVALARTSCSILLEGKHGMAFHTLDFLKLSNVQAMFPESAFDLIIDKGTLDAITLNPNVSDYTCSKQDTANRCQVLIQLYKASLQYLLKRPCGIFMITSCNWTREELLFHFSDYELVEHLTHAAYTFGGRTGQVVTTLTLKLK